MVVTKLAEQSLLTSEICSSNLVIGKFNYFWRVFTLDTKGPWFKASNWPNFTLNILLIIWKDKNNEKEAWIGPFIKQTIYSFSSFTKAEFTTKNTSSCSLKRRRVSNFGSKLIFTFSALSYFEGMIHAMMSFYETYFII